jgi:hypothetical protein
MKAPEGNFDPRSTRPAGPCGTPNRAGAHPAGTPCWRCGPYAVVRAGGGTPACAIRPRSPLSSRAALARLRKLPTRGQFAPVSQVYERPWPRSHKQTRGTLGGAAGRDAWAASAWRWRADRWPRDPRPPVGRAFDARDGWGGHVLPAIGRTGAFALIAVGLANRSPAPLPAATPHQSCRFRQAFPARRAAGGGPATAGRAAGPWWEIIAKSAGRGDGIRLIGEGGHRR